MDYEGFVDPFISEDVCMFSTCINYQCQQVFGFNSGKEIKCHLLSLAAKEYILAFFCSDVTALCEEDLFIPHLFTSAQQDMQKEHHVCGCCGINLSLFK